MSESFTKCPMCGYSVNQVAKPVSSQMNTYKNNKGELGVFPSHVGEFTTTNGITWIKQAPAPGTSPISLTPPKTSAAVKAALELSKPEVSLENSAGNPVTGVAKGAIIVGAPVGAKDSVTAVNVQELLSR